MAVRIEEILSSFFENMTALKQGNTLSPILFNIALQKVIQSIHCINMEKSIKNKTTFCGNGKYFQKTRTTDKPRKNKNIW
jgi:Na+/citrate or Na+/malate symporter